MRRIIFDACALINLKNGGVLPAVLAMVDHEWYIGHITLEESSSIDISMHVDSGEIRIIEDDDIDSGLFVSLWEKYSLGDGETECMTFSKTNGYIVCTDDKRARTCIGSECGIDKFTGSVGLLKLLAARNLITSEQAFESYELMKSMGAFLPKNLTLADFKAGATSTDVLPISTSHTGKP